VSNELEQNALDVVSESEKISDVQPEQGALDTENVGSDLSESSEKSTPTLHDVITTIGELRTILEDKIARDKIKDEAFERLYADLDEYKRNRSFEENKALYLDLVLFYDRLQASKATVECAATRDILVSIQEELTEILFRREIEPITERPVIFDPSFQRAVNTETIKDAAENGAVLRVLRDGFTHKGSVLRPQEVVVGRLAPPVVAKKEEQTPASREEHE